MTVSKKIFCIGVHKTGTRSLFKAFKILGLKPLHFKIDDDDSREDCVPEIIDNNYRHDRPLLTGIENYDAHCEMNWPHTNHLFKLLDKQYPGSKFILNTREINNWLKSRYRHIANDQLIKNRTKYPGNTLYSLNTELWRQEYKKHHEDVLNYFANRPSDLLIIDVCAGDGWEKLCPFLGYDTPCQLFPHENKGKGSIRTALIIGLRKVGLIRAVRHIKHRLFD